MKTIADHILDILQNSVSAGATLIEIIVCEDVIPDIYAVEIRDNGRGMTEEEAANALNPFFTTRTTRKVGLGLPLFRQNAEASGGRLSIQSLPGSGTTVRAEFGSKHIDRPAMGDIAGVFVLSAIGHPGVNFSYEHSTIWGTFGINTADLYEMLEGVPLSTFEVRRAVMEMIENNLAGIKASK
jgi:hypothetical protein